jgi:signal transduction histidine kinase
VRADFIATMSHELRTPLHIITGYQEILLDGGAGELTAEQHDTLVRCQRNAQTLLELVNATLDLTRLDAGFDPPVHTPVDVAEIVDAAIGDLADLARKPGVSLVVEHPDRAPQLATDPIKLKVIVKNLVGNAIKFTDRGTVTVRTGAADHGVAVTVSDSGIGIPESALAFIFEPFRQVDASNTRRHGGVGLGLHIVQRLADTLGGTISVESHVGRGSTFRLWLPRDAAGLKERAA